MLVNKILKVVLLLFCGVFVVLQGLAFEMESTGVSALLLIMLTIIYFVFTKNINKYFSAFLIIYSLGLVLSYLSWYGPDLYEGDIDYFYFTTNALFIFGYTALILKVISDLDIKTVVSKHAIPIFILIVLDVFCVSLVTATTESVLSIYEYSLEYIYNAIIMILLSVALVNYLHRNDNKSMTLLMGSMCIVFSEIIQLAYFYVLEDRVLVFVYSFFMVVAFIFFYLQSQQGYSDPEPPVYSEEKQLNF